ncbi:hypothetical protein SADO_12598 [Salinisphaera dokdonensis CL-ES53]|uniref:Large ribosomal RNA subunit accumulation protein YceD n=1 Tax=Salinisphaera dokdonensis CL-ES53 TaxID=1304272 RepID=A0ABV2B2K4_9GAMM
MNRLGTLAHRVDYRRLATQQGRASGEIELSRLPRVTAEMAGAARDGDTIAVDLEFKEDAQRRVRVEGTIDTTLLLECQRCLQVFDESMHVDVAGVVVGDDDAAANVPRDDEPVMADGDLLDVHALVADELLLAMPSVARCARPACSAAYVKDEAPRRETKEQEPNNPFAVLNQLKRND